MRDILLTLSVVILLSAMILVGYNQPFSHSDAQCGISTSSKLAAEIQRKVAFKLYQEKKLRAIGSGAQGKDQIKMLALSFCYYEPLNEEKARELTLIAINELISAVNEDEQIRPYLHNYPFESKNVEIRIFLFNPDGSSMPPGKLRGISATDGILDYRIHDPENELLTTILEETYDEAMQKQSLASASKIEVPQEHSMSN